MIPHAIDPAIVSLGPLSLRWYGVLYALGFVLAYFILQYLSKKKGMKLSADDVSDYLFYLILGVVLGARLFYVAVYNPLFYFENPLEIPAIWHGGLSFHGGLLGGLLATWYFCRKMKLSFYSMTDIGTIPLALGLGIGRIGNFINGELYGRVTSFPFCIDYSTSSYVLGVEGCRHASQLYESFYSFVLAGILLYVFFRNVSIGVLTWLFISLYGVFRFAAEFFREPDAQIGFLSFGLTMGQLLCVPMVIAGGYMVARLLSTSS